MITIYFSGVLPVLTSPCRRAGVDGDGLVGADGNRRAVLQFQRAAAGQDVEGLHPGVGVRRVGARAGRDFG